MFGMELSFIWAGIIAFSVLLYVILDGFDLGVGILFPTSKNEKDRDLMMNSIAPLWDGNETWLVMGGSGLMTAFPLAYAIVMPALYIPITIMLLALIFRGVAFEYRWRTVRWKRVWDHSFFAGSLVAAAMQGIALGALIQGFAVVDNAYVGGAFDWLSPFTILTGIAVPVGYALLGSTWLNMKLTGDLQERMRALAKPLAVTTLLFLGLFSILTPLQEITYAQRWFAGPNAIYTMAVPGMVGYVAWRLWSGLKNGHDVAPFLCSLALFVLAFIGIGISFYPMILPPDLSIAEAAAPETSLRFSLYGTMVLVPTICAYSAYAYWVFRGKMNPNEGYH